MGNVRSAFARAEERPVSRDQNGYLIYCPVQFVLDWRTPVFRQKPRSPRSWFEHRLHRLSWPGGAKIDNLGCRSALLKAHHDTSWSDVPWERAFSCEPQPNRRRPAPQCPSDSTSTNPSASIRVCRVLPYYKLHGVQGSFLQRLLPKWKTAATFGCRTLAAARASRKKRRRADSSPRYFLLITFNVTGHRRSTSGTLCSNPHRPPTQIRPFHIIFHVQFIMLKASTPQLAISAQR